MVLDDGEKRELLRRARAAIESAFSDTTLSSASPSSEPLQAHRGVFVTLRYKGDLRGCIGYVEPKLPLYRAAEEVALKAAFEDPRFPPLVTDEASEVEIEISVLSPLEEVRDIDRIEVGKHGLVIEAECVGDSSCRTSQRNTTGAARNF
jgi:AmmeMemoRadiSam system protein A